MSRYRIRYFLLAGAVIALPLLLLGVAPALQDLIQRLDLLEAESDTQPIVIDANGVQVGTVTSITKSNLPVAVMIDFEDYPLFTADVTTSTMRGNNGQLYFASSDCTGPPFVSPRTYILPVPWLSQALPGTPIYVEDRNAEPVVRVLQSRLFPTGVCEAREFTPLSVPAIPGPNWRDEFTPPFRVVTRREFLTMQGP